MRTPDLQTACRDFLLALNIDWLDDDDMPDALERMAEAVRSESPQESVLCRLFNAARKDK